LTIGLFSNTINAQSDQKLKERQERTVDTIFSEEEKIDLLFWYHDHVKKMNLNQDDKDLYNSILDNHFNKIKRLDDKDSELTEEERKDEISNIIKAMNSKLKPILSQKNYAEHLSVVNGITKMIYKKHNWEWKDK
jgi:hypothetical protein